MFTSKAVAVIFAFASLASAQDVDYDDLPSQCTSVCDPVVRLTQQCDNGRSDADQLSCVCQATNATALLPACEACYAMFDADGHDNDVNDLVSKCSFSTTSYVPAATMSGNQTASMTGGAGAPAMTSARATSSSGMGAAGTSSAAMTGSASDADTSSASMTNSGNDAQNTGAAAAIGMDGVVGLLAGAVGIAGLL